MKKIILFVLILVVVGGAWIAVNQILKVSTPSPASVSTPSTKKSTSKAPVKDTKKTTTTAGTTTTTSTTATTSITPPASVSTGSTATIATSAVKAFVVTGSNYSFTPSAINVNKGDKVKITFKNANGFHDFRIDEYGIATDRIQGGSEQTVEFVADKAGSFEYYCSVGNHRAMGMKGTLTVQ